MLASKNLIEFIQSFDVHDPNILTDHCCVSLVLEFPLSDNILPDERSDSFYSVNGKYLWNAELLNHYKNKLSSNSVQNQLIDLNDRILISTDQNGFNSYLSDFNEILSNVCTPFFKTYNTNSSYQYDEKRVGRRI